MPSLITFLHSSTSWSLFKSLSLEPAFVLRSRSLCSSILFHYYTSIISSIASIMSGDSGTEYSTKFLQNLTLIFSNTKALSVIIRTGNSFYSYKDRKRCASFLSVYSLITATCAFLRLKNPLSLT
jgi:fumarate reductase subunit C